MTRRIGVLVAILALGVVGGCVKRADDGAALHGGRYLGVGVYSAGALWRKLVTADNKDAAAAKLSDDDEVIVVVDSHTGELRQCGNLTGYCVVMNPWQTPAGASQRAPAKLTIHQEQLEAQARAEAQSKEASSTQSGAAPSR